MGHRAVLHRAFGEVRAENVLDGGLFAKDLHPYHRPVLGVKAQHRRVRERPLDTVQRHRQLVGSEVYQLDGARTPFADRAFDQVIIVDYLEHIPDDRAFADELARILTPGGILVVNVPHLQPRSPLNRFRHRIGLTDAWHGHLRAGYTVEGLREVLGPRFAIERVVTYSRFGSELVDTALNGMYEAMRKRSGGESSSKGAVVTAADVGRHRKQLRLLSLLYPALKLTASTDRLMPWQPGHKLIVRARLLG